MRASLAVGKAIGWGYQRVYYFRDGFVGWRAAGYPVATVQSGDVIEGVVQ
jgi:rhodanese-related sulfurtransferase